MSTSTTPRPTHHHGNLRAALVEAGIEMLEADETFSLRAVAKRVGVSATAPYRHFESKEHLEAAMAAQGFRALRERLEQTLAHQPQPLDSLVEPALAAIHYAVENPALYGLMFGRPCGHDDERLQASASLFALLEEVAAQMRPAASARGLATGSWALTHGLASLVLDGKLQTEPEGLDTRVREAFSALRA